MSVNSPNILNQCAIAADNTGGPQIIATSNGAPGTLTIRASQMNISSIILSSINGNIYPPPASQVISTFSDLNTSTFTVSTINGVAVGNFANSNVFQNLFTSTFVVSTINNVNWSTISLQNQGPAVDPANRYWVVTASNNILCVVASNPTPPTGFVQNGLIPLTIGTYDNTSFPVMVNAAIQAFSAANGGRFGNLVCSITSVVGVIVSASFSSSQPAPTPPLIGTQYTLDFTPGDFALFPGATALLIAGSAALFGATNPSSVVVVAATPSTPAATVVLPIPNTNAFTGPITPFGPNLLVSSLKVQGVPVLTAASLTPSGAIIMFGGATAPSGWLICDGSTYSSAVYPILFSVIGYLYGGAGSNFQVPDFQTRTPVGSITGASAPSPAVMTLPNNGSSSVFVIIQLGTTAVTTTPLNVIVPGCVFTAGAVGPYTVSEMIYADYGRNVYLCKLNATLGGGGQAYTGTITFPKSSVASPNTTLPYQPGFTAPAYYAPSLAPNQLPPHTHNYNIQTGGAATYNTDGANQACGDPNKNFGNSNTVQTSPSSGGPGFDTTGFQFPAGLIGPQNVVALGVQPLPSVSINYLIKV
jgi:microcystin-dependent protein